MLRFGYGNTLINTLMYMALCIITDVSSVTDVPSVSNFYFFLFFFFFQNLGADFTDLENTTRTDTVTYGSDTSCYGYNG